MSNQQINLDELNQQDIEQIEDETDGQVSFNYDPDKLNIGFRQPTIEQILRRISEEALNLAPDFQRQASIWKDDVKSRLIESIMIRIPLPAFYIDGTDEEEWLVVDGLQRLSALKEFISDKKLKLTGLEYLTEIEGKNYDEIPRKYQRRIEETQINIYIIEKGTPPEVKYNVFKRINTGGERLSNQELRHALNPGKAGKILKTLAQFPEFTKVLKLGQSRKDRMEDREFILGFLAVTLGGYIEYDQKGRDTFLDESMGKINQLSDIEMIELEEKFKRTMIECYTIFSDNAFRKISRKKTSKNPQNKALFECWSFWISTLDDLQLNQLKQRKEKLMDRFAQEIDQNPEFLKSVSQAANKIKYRFTKIEEIINEVLA